MTPRFRVWDGETMHEPPHDYTIDGQGRLQQIPASREGTSWHQDHEVMLFTGLADADGTEIWEGDVVGWGGKDSPQPNKRRGIVVFRSGSWMIERPDGIHVRLSRITDSSVINFSVRGNRHENPQLVDEVSA